MTLSKSKRCPKCSNRIFWNPNTMIDIVHTCRNSDGTIKTSNKASDHDFTREPLKMEDPNWDQFGLDPQQPESTISDAEFDRKSKTELPIRKLVPLEGC